MVRKWRKCLVRLCLNVSKRQADARKSNTLTTTNRSSTASRHRVQNGTNCLYNKIISWNVRGLVPKLSDKGLAESFCTV